MKSHAFHELSKKVLFSKSAIPSARFIVFERSRPTGKVSLFIILISVFFFCCFNLMKWRLIYFTLYLSST
jgi:hypothetical protein